MKNFIVIFLLILASSLNAESYLAVCPKTHCGENSQLEALQSELEVLLLSDQGSPENYSIKKIKPQLSKIKNSYLIHFAAKALPFKVYVGSPTKDLSELKLFNQENREELVHEITDLRASFAESREAEQVEIATKSAENIEKQQYQKLLTLKKQLEVMVNNDSQQVTEESLLSKYRAQQYNQQLAKLALPTGIKSTLLREVEKLRLEKIKLKKEYEKLVKEYEQ